MKKKLIILSSSLFFFVFGVFSVFALTSLSSVEERQYDAVSKTGYFVQEKLGEVDPNIEVWVYETPSKDLGYQIIEYAPDGSWVSSTGYGTEAKERTFLDVKDDRKI